MERAEFILEGNAEGVVAAFHIQRRALREAEAELRKFTNNAKTLDEEAIKGIKERAKNVIDLKLKYQDASKAVKELGRQQKDAMGGAAEKMEHGGIKIGRRYREIANQVAYGIGDIMSVQGGIAEMIRASANNVQYMAGMIPGVTGLYAMFGATAAQAIGMLWAKLAGAKDATKEAADAAKESHKVWADLVDMVQEARMSEQDYAAEKDRLGIAEKASKADVAKAKALEVLAPLYRADQAMRKPVGERTSDELRDSLYGAASEVWRGLANLTVKVATVGISPAPFNTPDQNLMEAKADFAARSNEAAAIRRMADEATAARTNLRRAKEGESILGKVPGSKESIERAYGDALAKEGKEGARDEVIFLLRDTLPEALKGGASRIADNMIQEFMLSESAAYMKNRLDETSPEFAGVTAANKQAKQARAAFNAAKVGALEDGSINSVEKFMLKGLEDTAKKFEILAGQLAENAKLQMEANRLEAQKQADKKIPQMAPIDAGGNSE